MKPPGTVGARHASPLRSQVMSASYRLYCGPPHGRGMPRPYKPPSVRSHVRLEHGAGATVLEALAEAGHAHALHVLLDLPLADGEQQVHALVDLVFAAAHEDGERGVAGETARGRVLAG